MALQDAWFNDTFVKALNGDIALGLGITSPGRFWGALFTDQAEPDFSQINPAYGTAPLEFGESSGAGYTAGGAALTVVSWGQLSEPNKVGWRFATVSWEESTISASGLLVYIPSMSNKAVICRAFGGTYATEDGTFEISWGADGGTWRIPLRAAA